MRQMQNCSVQVSTKRIYLPFLHIEIGTLDCFPPKMWIFPEKKYMIAFAGSNANSVKLQIEFQRFFPFIQFKI